MVGRRVKEWGLCVLVGISAGVAIVGSYPILVGMFAVTFLAGGSRGILLALSLLGMAVFLPVEILAKYVMVVLVISVAVKVAECMGRGCPTWLGAVFASLATFILSWAGALLKIPGEVDFFQSNFVMAALESLFIFSFVMFATPLLYFFLERGRGRAKVKKTSVRTPERATRLRSYAESFTTLAGMFSQMSRPKEAFETEELGKMQQEIIEGICISCGQCAVCWEPSDSPLYGVFRKLFHAVEKFGFPDQEAREGLAEYCIQPVTIAEAAIGVFERARINLSWYNRLLENREVIAQQLDAMAYILEDCAVEYRDVTGEKKKLVSDLRFRLKERGLWCSQIQIYERQNGRLSLRLHLFSKGGNSIKLKEATKAVTQGMKTTMIPGKDSVELIGKEEEMLTFEEEPRFYTLYGVSRRPKEDAEISGDNFSFLDLEPRESILTLSDGMGFGIRACQESEMVIELIEKFLETGFRKEVAIGLMNSAMVMYGEEGMYSTLDMAAVDLYTGISEFYKIGGAAAFVKREKKVEVISASSLPAGIFPRVEIEQSCRQLKSGDFLLLVSDGVLDYLPGINQVEQLKEIIETTQSNNPGKLAQEVMDKVLLFTGGRAADDMTVLVAGIWEK